MLSRHLSHKHCCIFPASTTTSKLTSPFDVVQVNISLLFLVLLFPGFLVMVWSMVWSVCWVSEAPSSKRKTKFAMFCEFQTKSQTVKVPLPCLLFWALYLGTMMKPVCWHSRRSKACLFFLCCGRSALQGLPRPARGTRTKRGSRRLLWKWKSASQFQQDSVTERTRNG